MSSDGEGKFAQAARQRRWRRRFQVKELFRAGAELGINKVLFQAIRERLTLQATFATPRSRCFPSSIGKEGKHDFSTFVQYVRTPVCSCTESQRPARLFETVTSQTRIITIILGKWATTCIAGRDTPRPREFLGRKYRPRVSDINQSRNVVLG